MRRVTYLHTVLNAEITASERGAWRFVFHLICGRVRITRAINNGDETVSEMMEYELWSLFGRLSKKTSFYSVAIGPAILIIDDIP
jgi:hypothetical protein